MQLLPSLSTDIVFFYTIRCFHNTVARQRSKVVRSGHDCETSLLGKGEGEREGAREREREDGHASGQSVL